MMAHVVSSVFLVALMCIALGLQGCGDSSTASTTSTSTTTTTTTATSTTTTTTTIMGPSPSPSPMDRATLEKKCPGSAKACQADTACCAHAWTNMADMKTCIDGSAALADAATDCQRVGKPLEAVEEMSACFATACKQGPTPKPSPSPPPSPSPSPSPSSMDRSTLEKKCPGPAKACQADTACCAHAWTDMAEMKTCKDGRAALMDALKDCPASGAVEEMSTCFATACKEGPTPKPSPSPPPSPSPSPSPSSMDRSTLEKKCRGPAKACQADTACCAHAWTDMAEMKTCIDGEAALTDTATDCQKVGKPMEAVQEMSACLATACHKDAIVKDIII